ncbi:MAG: MFS transporter [Actinomycetota bacterium]|nr:MFS transporter [Actinomycetota bacterium]
MRGGRSGRGLLVDVGPLRRSRHFRNLWLGFLINTIGSQLTMVAVPYQVYRATDSTLQVGLVSLAQLAALLVGSLVGGVVADHLDRRRLLVLSQVALGLASAALALNVVSGHPLLVVLYLASALSAGVSGIGGPTRTALVVHLVEREDLVAANALWQLLFQIGTVVGPSIAGVLAARVGLGSLYGADAVTYLAAIAAAAALPAPAVDAGRRGGLSFASFREGFGYLRSQRVLQATYLVDLNAMIFGMPRALFPALALGRFHGGPEVLGLLYSAPGVGALLAALLTGWAARISRQGIAVLAAVSVWGLAIAGFGWCAALGPALACLAVAGGADVVSAIFRGTILQVEAPDELRGRVQGVQFAVVAGGPRLGDVEAGLVASGLGVDTSVISGGLACLAGVALLAWRLPQFVGYQTPSAAVGKGAGEEEWGAGVEGLDSIGLAPEAAEPLIARREPGEESVGG